MSLLWNPSKPLQAGGAGAGGGGGLGVHGLAAGVHGEGGQEAEARHQEAPGGRQGGRHRPGAGQGAAGQVGVTILAPSKHCIMIVQSVPDGRDVVGARQVPEPVREDPGRLS